MSDLITVHLSKHAEERIIHGDKDGPRTTLSIQEVCAILVTAIPIGVDPDQEHVVYRLFYSLTDEKHFVSVQDERSPFEYRVITILPIEMFIPGRHGGISLDALKEASRLGRQALFKNTPSQGVIFKTVPLTFLI